MTALLEAPLITFQQSVTLRLAAVAEGPVGRDQLVDEVTGALKIDAVEAHGVIDELIAALPLAPDEVPGVRITDAGRELHGRTSGETAPVTGRIYDGIPAEDLAVAGRVLSLITERADDEPAALAE
ncbi:MarR family transcriptional regulator [Streptomyces violaceus]|uniref:MarR family transcriptional regulator n=1 Tax=Streptomyces violaceus TaxID=1936 RepID=A0ABY9ULA3_STRVL|nr:MarR family transcriptional regulator [Streptomyces janthinus]WND23671.1 MarR family transcriptional regulator [Streptomyces janthinus]